MKKKVLLILALLCAIVQGTWADDDYGYPTKTKPEFHASYGGKSNVVVINTAAELAYITEHFYEDSGFDVDRDDWSQLDYYLNADIDMGTEHSWLPMGIGSNTGYSGKFWGNGHTITYYIWDLDEAGQGLFSAIHTYGRVYDVNVICKIFSHQSLVGGIAGKSWGHIENCTATVNILCHEVHCVGGIVGYTYSGAFVAGCHVMGRIECTGPSMQVGGITGCIDGAYITTVRNCWVEADIITDEAPSLYNADVGGIAGQNEYCVEYCCMTGNVTVKGKETGVGGIVGSNEKTVSHCTFYGTVSVNKDQKNKYVGGEAPAASSDNMYDAFNQDEYNDAKSKGYDLYCQAIKYPYAVNVTTVGQGSVTVSADGEDNIPGARQHQEVTLTTTTGSTAEVTVTDADGNNLTLFGNSGASGYTFIMPQKNVNVHAIFTVPDWPRQGSGTTDSPYLITSADDWNEFALSVNAGINHSGKHVKLTNDISIWMMAGASKTNSFQGTFDGDGHTLTFNCNNTTAVTAPFRYTKNAIIKNLRTAGSIATDAMNAAGIVGDVTGSLSLTNCCSAVTISSSRSDADFHGGLVASNNGSVTISGCVFDGSFVATVAHTNQYGTTYCGGFVGYGGSNSSTTITNSLVATTSVSEGMVSHTFVVTNDGTVLSIGNSYFVATTNLPTNQGQQAHTISAGDDVTISDIGEATTTYGSDGITVYGNGIKYRDTFFVVSGKTVSLTLSHGDKMGYHFSQYAASAGTISAQTESSATLTMPAANITINAEWTKFIDGTGTADDPYVIDNADKWNYFANSVNGGYAFSGNFVKLGDDISVSTMAGTSDANSFQGTFDGNSKTLTFTKGTSAEPFAEEYCAPFRHVKNAVIKNLHVDGTIYTNRKKAAGIVGESHGALTLTGCISSVNINSSIKGDGTHGGLVSTLSGSGNDITIDGCVFDGSFATTNGTKNCGGFIGWGVYNKPTIKNSLMKPGSVAADMLNSTFARWYTGNEGIYEPTITNSYYVATTNLPTDQGTAAVATATAPANLGSLVEDYGIVKAYANGILVGGTYYVAPATISLANAEDNSTAISNANGYLADVTLADRTLYKDGGWNTLTLPFDVTLDGSPLKDAVARTLTSGSIEGTTLNLTFGDPVDELEAGTPYIIKWTKADDYVDDNKHNLVNPVFHGVTIDADADGNYDTETASPAVTTDERVRFLGTYKSTAFDAEDKSILLMGGSNTLYWPLSDASIGAQRAYFKLGEDGTYGARITSFSIDFGDDDNTTTGIIEAEANSSLYPLPSTVAEGWYDMQGRKIDNDKLSNGKMPRGVYIRGGRKVVVK